MKCIKGKKVTRSSKHGFVKGKTCLAILITFYNKMTSSLNEEITVGVVYLDFNKAFSSISYNILIN